MWPKLVIGVVALRIMCSVVKASSSNGQDVRSLPYCPSKNGSGAVLVSTLDGKLSSINSSGHLSWEIETGPGPLLISNIHKLELTNNGEWIRIIPSLSGTLYKFDGNTIDPISINAETLLRSSFRYSDDLVIAGGIEVRTYGVGFRTGKLLYECSHSKCTNHETEEIDDVMVVERSTQTIRAVEPRTGHERWNFSVGLHNVKLPQVSCIDTKMFDSNISAIIPEGILSVSSVRNSAEFNWQYKFHSPIVRVWKWDGMKLSEINLFEPKNMPGLITQTAILPSIYIGMHKKQLYIHESLDMQQILQGRQNTDLVPAESSSIVKIPWKPISASFEATEDDSTALSVLNNSEYVNGNGYYLYSEHDLNEKDSMLCEKNHSSGIIDPLLVEEEIVYAGLLSYLGSYFGYYKQYILMAFTAALGPILFKFWNKSNPKDQEIIIIEKPVEAQVTRPERQNSERSTEGFRSRFMDDFDTISCLGRGGFGVVFEVKQKIEDCHYAIKRIRLPYEEKSRDRVMREVKALAVLEHKNIVRYYNCWLERPPLGWEQDHDRQYMELSSFSGIPTTYTETTASPVKRMKSASISINIPLQQFNEPSFDTNSGHISSEDDEDSFVVFEKDESRNQENDSKGTHSEDSLIVFENSTSNNKEIISEAEDSLQTLGNKTHAVDETLPISEHLQKKIDWKRPGRKHHSWDITQNNSVPRDPPMYLYIQMQLCQKESLKEWLNMNKERDYEYIINVFSQILDAVEYVHQMKLIHRDLKPSNIFFSLQGQIKVGDFGLAKDIESSFDLELNRRNNAVSYRGHTKEVGSELYMSPEQVKGGNYDNKVDIYSLGVILFELLVPFSTEMERFKTLTDLKKQKKYPDGFAEKFPSEFLLLQNMLHEDPDKRFTTKEIMARKPFNKNNSTVED